MDTITETNSQTTATRSEKVRRSKYVLKTRVTLYFLVFSGFIIHYVYRININIAIVNMVENRIHTQNIIAQHDCYVNTGDTFNINRTTDKEERLSKITSTNFTNQIITGDVKFNWNEYDQNLVLGAFFWFSWSSSFPGGILTQKYGTKLIFGMSNLIGCALCFVIPIAASSSIRFLIFIRILQGFGAAFPSMHNLIGAWVPPNERSLFLTSYLGVSVGAAIFYPIFGYIIAWTSWNWVFYTSGILGLLWYASWLYNVYDTPQEHPRIKQSERIYIARSLGDSVQMDKKNIPWKKLLTSLQVWVIVIAQFGALWGMLTAATQTPTYFKFIHNFGIREVGLVSGLPQFLRIGWSFIFSYTADYLTKHNLATRTNVTKYAGFIAFVLNGTCFIGLAYSGCNYVVSIIFLVLITITQSAHISGVLVTMVCIAPNYASMILGLCSSTGLLSGFMSANLVGWLTYENQTSMQWKYIFLISGGIIIISGIPYMLLTNANVLKWNQPKNKDCNDVELENLKTDQNK